MLLCKVSEKNVINNSKINLSSQSSAIDFSPKISGLDAINYIAEGWRSVTPQAIANCWRHADFVRNVLLNNDGALSHNNLADVVSAGVIGRAEFETVDNNIVCTEELDDL